MTRRKVKITLTVPQEECHWPRTQVLLETLKKRESPPHNTLSATPSGIFSPGGVFYYIRDEIDTHTEQSLTEQGFTVVPHDEWPYTQSD